jgi:uncharacterized protein (DUF2126 family)/transglutaminase-like putative cysteine protease
MTIRVALHHRTSYRFDRLVALSAHEVRLRPAPHCRTPIPAYSIQVSTPTHFLNWQQDPYGNYIARYTFPEKLKAVSFSVDLVAEMTVINPFDFFVESYAEHYPFQYAKGLAKELVPFLETEAPGPLLAEWLKQFRAATVKPGININDFLVAVNRGLQRDIGYLVRMQPGVQTPEETLKLKCGSCRDSGWLLVQILRHLGLAARFVSGYLIQLSADVKALDGPSGPAHDFTDLHAWAEVYLPGAGWIGLDPTSGLLAGEGHIPLACTAAPASAAPIVGYTDPCESEFDVVMKVTRIHEDPRVTKPYTEAQWQAIGALGREVDVCLNAADVRLTQGGEPTFVSIDDMDGAEWNYTALSPAKRKLAGALVRRLRKRFAPGGLLHFGQGKWYPGEPLPRWALSVFWRNDGVPLWTREDLIAGEEDKTRHGSADAGRLAGAISTELGLTPERVVAAYEDVLLAAAQEALLPDNMPPGMQEFANPDERARLARTLTRLTDARGYVLPLAPAAPASRAESSARWRSSAWPFRREHLFLLPGDSPLGLRLPLASLPHAEPDPMEIDPPCDPFEQREALPIPRAAVATATREKSQTQSQSALAGKAAPAAPAPGAIVRTALCIEARDGRLYVFLPPLTRIEDFIDLVAAIERAAAATGLPLWLEGYAPPRDERIGQFSVTPDPGVIEVNIHPAANWDELAERTTVLYEEARLTRLGAEKFMLDGRHTGTGGGNHVTLGGKTAADSPMLRRPDLLVSLVSYWQNHPALSYLFSGMFIGPTSQAPRADEARDDNLYELEIAFQQMAQALPPGKESQKPWLVDRLLRHLLVDLTGNTHRAEFSIDKLYSPDSPTGRLGLVEMRAFEMPPHPQMSLAQMLLLRALVAHFWKHPYRGRLIPWGTELHDRFMLPHFVEHDMRDVVRDLNHAGFAFDAAWLAPFLEFRFPRYGTVAYDDVQIELKRAIEPWNVLGEEMAIGGTSRYVDSSVERMQVKVNGMTGSRHLVSCNGRALPLHPTGVHGEFVAGVRYRAWAPPSALHPTIGVHTPLVFDLVDTWNGRSLGGCTYHVSHPGGRSYDTFPVNANEAEARRIARFWSHGHTPGRMQVQAEPLNPAYPHTLDLRRQAV